MELLLRGAYLEIFPDLRASVERGLGHALNRGRLEALQATVCLRSSGGSRWHCVIGVRIRGQGRLRAKASAPLPSAALEEAFQRLGRETARAAARRTRSSRRNRRSIEAPPQWGGRRLSLT